MTHALDAARSFLTEAEHQVWLVGATALDSLHGEPSPHCVELLTDAPPEVCALATAAASQLLPDGGLVDIETLGQRSLSDALGQRGITLDAVAVASDGTVIDPFEGLAHQQAGQIRTILPPDRAFREQPGLLFGLARVIAWTGMTPSTDLRRLATRDSGNILDVTDRPRSWGAELNKLLLGGFVDLALQWLEDTRVLPFVMPEIAAMVGFDKSCAVHHKDIWEHTRIVANKAVPQLVIRWAALCHDIGKVWTRSVNKAGKVHFFRHEEHGALLFESIAHRVGLDPTLTQRVSYLIENHSRVNLYADDWTDSAVRRLIRQTDGHLDDLINFSKCDYTTKRESRIRQMQRLMVEFEVRVARIIEEDARVPPLSKGIGNAIMKRFALGPSRLIGTLKSTLEAQIEAGTLPERAGDDVYLEWLTAHTVAEIEEAGGTV
jgi:poly(A) polymerase